MLSVSEENGGKSEAVDRLRNILFFVRRNTVGGGKEEEKVRMEGKKQREERGRKGGKRESGSVFISYGNVFNNTEAHSGGRDQEILTSNRDFAPQQF